jgi:uncharacterized protein YqfA (UPF0365 family)
MTLLTILAEQPADGDEKQWLLFVVLLIFLVPVWVMGILMLTVARPWLRAMLAGVQLSVFDVIGMRLRRVPINEVVDALVAARASGVELSHVDVQRAHMRGVDLRKLTLAYIESHRRQLGYTFEELVDFELKDELAAALKKPPDDHRDQSS